jgi:hypothetical protein
MFQAGSPTVVLPDVVAVRWKGGVAKQVRIVPQQKLPAWLERSLVVMMIFGFISALYLVVRLAIFVF